jgi:hypothetical protein
MNSGWKFVTLMILTLVIGIAIGALLNRALIQTHLRHVVQMRATGFFGPGEKMLLGSATPEQQKRIREILDRHRERLGEIHSRFSREIQASFLTLKKEIDPILTPEQKNHLTRMFPPPPPPFPDFRRDGMNFPPHRPAPFMRIETLKDELLLSDDQVSKIEDVMKEFRDRSESLNQNGGFPDFRELMKTREAMEARIETILTAEQKEKFSRFKKMRPPPPY